MTQMSPAPKLPQKLLENCRMLEDRNSLLYFLPKDKVVVEIGVALGDFSWNLINYCQPSKFIAIDIFKLHELPEFWGKSPRAWFGDKTHLDFFRDKFSSLIKNNKVAVLEGDSSEQMKGLDDKSVGVFYVDGDHSYEGVIRDLNQIKEKISDDGIIIMNDYIMRDDHGAYGVVQATNEFMIDNEWEMIFFCLQTSMYCDVAIRRVGSNTKCKTWTELESENQKLRNDIRIIKNSNSWKFGSVVRFFGGIFR